MTIFSHNQYTQHHINIKNYKMSKYLSFVDSPCMPTPNIMWRRSGANDCSAYLPVESVSKTLGKASFAFRACQVEKS